VEPAPIFAPPTTRPDANDWFIQWNKPSGATPRRADGHPDLSGNWGAINFTALAAMPGRRTNEATEPDQATLQRSGHYYKPVYKPEYWDKVRALDFSIIDTDPAYGCTEKGVPRMGIPTKIGQFDNEIWLNRDDITRFIPIGGRKLTEEDEDQQTRRGVSVAHWDGEVLIIESVGFTGETWLAWEGLFHSDRMKLTERLWRDGDLLYYNFTVDDPVVFIKPWRSATQFTKLNPNPLALPAEPLPCQIANPRAVVDQRDRG
jgi:hypothetical protein